METVRSDPSMEKLDWKGAKGDGCRTKGKSGRQQIQKTLKASMTFKNQIISKVNRQ